MAYVKTHVVPRRNASGGRSAAEHLVAALRCLYRYAQNDKPITQSDNPARKVDKPRRLPSTRQQCRIPGWPRSIKLLRRAMIRSWTRCYSGCTPRPHADAVALRPADLDPDQCLILLREKGETVRWQLVSHTLMARLIPARSAAPCPCGRAAAALYERSADQQPPVQQPVGSDREPAALGADSADQHARR